MKLLELAAQKAVVQVYVGWSDGVAEPTLTSGEIDLPATRTGRTSQQFYAKVRQCLL